jgi:hypothetical protein
VHQKLSLIYEKGGYGIHSNPAKAQQYAEMASMIQDIMQE